MSGAYRDGVFSASSPAPRYGSLMTSFENGSLGGVLEDNAAALLDPALNKLALQTAAAVKGFPANVNRNNAVRYGTAAVALAKAGLTTNDLNEKLGLAVAAGYAASAFGLPPDTLLETVGRICDMFAMTGNQRAALHQQGASLLHSYLSSQKGSPMSGVFQDGVLGSVYRDGVLGAVASRASRMSARKGSGTTRVTDRIVSQVRSVRDGSLGALMYQPHAVRDGALGRARTRVGTPNLYPSRPSLPLPQLPQKFRGARAVSGCGCAGVGEDTLPPEAPFYKKPLVIGGAAIGLGLVIYAISRK